MLAKSAAIRLRCHADPFEPDPLRRRREAIAREHRDDGTPMSIEAKICGLSTPETVDAAIAAGAN